MAIREPNLPAFSDLPSFDSYDLWATSFGVWSREQFYVGKLSGKASAAMIAAADWIIPKLSRQIAGVKPKIFPISFGHWILCQDDVSKAEGELYLSTLMEVAAQENQDSVSWGLGFPWMSKNGLYGVDIPFVTHTPYVMEALLHLAQKCPELEARILSIFDKTYGFLQSLKEMHDTKDELALSYAPVDEPRIVINANSYAAYALSLHLEAGRLPNDVGQQVHSNIQRLLTWICRQQQSDGSWYYYADAEPGNFIDCFHSCFVIKNLHKTRVKLPEYDSLLDPVIQRAKQHLEDGFRDDSGLMKRFTVRDIKDPFVFDLYDQAEFLGVLLDLNELDAAESLAATTLDRFVKNEKLHNRIDVFGRRTGCENTRWGILPFYHQLHRLQAKRDQ